MRVAVTVTLTTSVVVVSLLAACQPKGEIPAATAPAATFEPTPKDTSRNEPSPAMAEQIAREQIPITAIECDVLRTGEGTCLGILSVACYDDDCAPFQDAGLFCGIPEGCGPRYMLKSPSLDSGIPLLGNVDDRDWYRLVRVTGILTELPESEFGTFYPEAYDGPTQAILVESQEVVGAIRYHDFLVEASGAYVQDRYPCLARGVYGRVFTTWNKEFSWTLEGDRPLLRVRLTDTTPSAQVAFIELSYDARTGDLVRETKELTRDPCAN